MKLYPIKNKISIMRGRQFENRGLGRIAPFRVGCRLHIREGACRPHGGHDLQSEVSNYVRMVYF